MEAMFAGVENLSLHPSESPRPVLERRKSSADSSHTALARPEGREDLSCELPLGMDLSHFPGPQSTFMDPNDWLSEYSKGNWSPTTIPEQIPLSPHRESESIYLSPTLGLRDTSSISSGDTSLSSPSSSLKLSLKEEARTYFEEGWLPAPRPEDEEGRRQALYRSQVLKKESHGVLDKIVRLAQRRFSVVTVLIMMAEKDTFPVLAAHGFESDVPGPRGPSLCAHTILQQSTKPFVILDTHQDWRFVNHPYVTSGKHFRFYAGTALKSEDGYSLGSLCVIDDQPRLSFSQEDSDDLEDLGILVMREIELYTARQEVLQRTLTAESVERFSRETLTMTDLDFSKVSEGAASHIQEALSIDGSGVFDLSALEFAPESTAEEVYRLALDGSALFGALPSLHHDPDHPPPPSAAVALLGSSGATPSILSSFSTPHHIDLARFLAEGKAQTFTSSTIPAWFGCPLPTTVASVLVLPVFSIDRSPIALVVAFSLDERFQFTSGHKSYLDQVGQILVSSFLRRKLLQSDRAKQVFVGNISHELRTPLHVIQGHCELMADTVMTSEQQRCLRSIHTSCQSLSETVNHVLEFSKEASRPHGSEEPVHTPDTTRFDLGRFLEEVVDEVHLGLRPTFARASDVSSGYTSSPSGRLDVGAETMIDIEPRAAGWLVEADRAGLRRAVTNVYSNARKYTDSGSIIVSLREVPQTPSATSSRNVKVEIKVEDSGRGMSSSFQRHNLWMPFSQEDALAPGAGLGLAMSRSVIQSMHGQIVIKSEKNVGTQVVISLELEQPLGPRNPPKTSFGQGRIVEFVGSPKDAALNSSRLRLEQQLVRWEFQVVHAASPASLDVDSVNIFILDESDSRHLALPRRVIVLTTDEPPSTSPDGRVFLRRPLGPVKVELALRAILRLHDPLPTPPSSAEASSVSVAISSSSSSPASMPRTLPIPIHPPPRLPAPRRGSRLPTRLVSHESRPFKILVVDDNMMNRKVLNRFLEKKGCVLSEAENGKVAARIFAEHSDEPFDFVLLDLQMPLMDGFSSCLVMRKEEETRDARSYIFALTGLSSSEDKVKAFDVGMDEYLVKPVSLKALWVLLTSYVESSAS